MVSGVLRVHRLVTLKCPWVRLSLPHCVCATALEERTVDMCMYGFREQSIVMVSKHLKSGFKIPACCGVYIVKSTKSFEVEMSIFIESTCGGWVRFHQ